MAANVSLGSGVIASALPSMQVVDLTRETEPLKPTSEPETQPEGEDGSEDQWESDSLYEDVLGAADGSAPQTPVQGPDVCTPEETVLLQNLLRTVGEDRFIEETLESERFSAKKLCTAFGVYPPAFLDGAPDAAFYQLLQIALKRHVETRQKLKDFNSIADAVTLLKRSKNIVVLTGAGISTSLGIPDFRSKDTGLYSKLEHLGLDDPQQVFDIDIFQEDPTVFSSIAKDIIPASARFSPTHAFIRLLQDKGKLLTNFTQNIDNLESHAGILSDKLIQCHGSFATATCQKCKAQVKGDNILPELRSGTVARCSACTEVLERLERPGMKRKRSSDGPNGRSKKKKSDWDDDSDDSDSYDVPEAGVMKPDITFFGEALPSVFARRLFDHDRERVDLVIVIGTSLKVAPVARVPTVVPPNVPQIYISRDPCRHVNFDIELLGECDVIVAELCKRAGWALDHEMVVEDAKVDVRQIFGSDSRWMLKSSSPDGRLPTKHQADGAKSGAACPVAASSTETTNEQHPLLTTTGS